MYARLRCGGNLPLCVRGLGTRNPLLRYGIDTRCQKRHPTVRDAFSEALRAQNRLLGYGREIRYQKHPPPVRGAVRPLLRYEVQFAPLLRYGVQFIQRRAAPETTFWCME